MHDILPENLFTLCVKLSGRKDDINYFFKLVSCKELYKDTRGSQMIFFYNRCYRPTVSLGRGLNSLCAF